MTNTLKLAVTVSLVGIVAAGVVALTHKSKTVAASLQPSASDAIRYLPIGDSYTIGESVSARDRWPNQLAAAYKPAGKTLDIIANPAVTGYTTQDVINTELPLVAQLKPDFVTVQIGVNDYVQGVDLETFQHNLRYIVAQLQSTMAQPKNILLVTIPDYAKTPTGAQFGDPATASQAIAQFNEVIIDEAQATKLPYADIFAVSQAVTKDRSLIADDGLHPSGKQYATWVSVIQQSLKANGLRLPAHR